jgi:hypothetical protein
MKKIFLIVALCFISHICLAQYNTTLVVSPNPPGSLLSWGRKDLTYIISGSAGVAGQVLIKATLKTIDGTLAASTNLAKARAITINPATGVLVLYAPDVIPLETMIFNGKFKTSMDRSGKLPAGTYTLCVQLVRPVDFFPMSQEQCKNFTIAAFQLPIPMMPANEMVLDLEKAKTAITFRWTPVAPRPLDMLTYRVTVFEILPNQTPMQALRSNQPILAKDIIGTTQYIWMPQLALTLCCKEEDVTGDEKNINTSEAGLGSGKDQKMNRSGNDSATQKNINTSEAGLGSGKDGKMLMYNDDMDAYAFIWTIQTLDSHGDPFGDGNINGDGISEPNVFLIDRRPIAKRKSGPPTRVNNLNGKKN